MMEINKTRFGNHGGNEISLYELKNDNDMIVKVMNYGATITSISIPNAVSRSFAKFANSPDFIPDQPVAGGMQSFIGNPQERKFNILGSDFFQQDI